MSGLTDKEVADEMAIATDTVRNYWKRIRAKVGGNSRAEIIATMVRLGMIREVEAKQTENEQLLSEIAKRRIAEQERHRLLIELEQQRSWLQAILQQMPCGLMIAEAPSGRLIQWNPRMEAIVGGPIDTLLDENGRLQAKGVDQGGREYQPGDWPLQRTVRTGEAVQSEIINIHAADGQVRQVSVSSGPVLDRAGNVVAAVAIWDRAD
jgi:PAS domain-containing protein